MSKHALRDALAERIITGLRQSTIRRCSEWASMYRVMGQPFPGLWTFRHHPWLREMHDCEAELIVGRKSAQMGYSECALNRAFYCIDTLGESVLYVLPTTTPDASDFSSARFDPALEASDHLSNLFTDVKNVGHKRAGTSSLYIRGSKSRSQLKSIPVANLFLDEVDEMEQRNIPLAFERTSGQVNKRIFMISTPTVSEQGIDEFFVNSTQEHFFFRCPRCNRFTELIFPECLVITAEDYNSLEVENSHLICKECGGVLPHEDKINWLADGKWIAQRDSMRARGFHINQLYSMAARPYEIAISYLKSLLNPFDEQEFYNSKLGKPHIVAGAQIVEADVKKCKKNFKKQHHSVARKMVTMGVDVGKWLHFEIVEWDLSGTGVDLLNQSRAKVIREDKFLAFEELDTLMRDYQINFCVIDANPETRKADEFCLRFPGRVLKCYYRDQIGKSIQQRRDDRYVLVDRTVWMDCALVRFRNETISLPMDLSFEYMSHITVPVRTYERDKNGNPMARYCSGTKADHFAHTRTYSEVALAICTGVSVVEDIRS